jgi:merozoite surface protein 4
MTNRPTRLLAVLTAVAAIGVGTAAPVALARHGADDPVGHDVGDDHGAHHRGHGADDPADHDARDDRRAHRGHHHRHHDDGPNHR